MEQSFHVRSISMPTRAHPVALNVEEELQKLSILASSSMTAETMCKELKGLEDLYISIDDLLHLPGTQQNLNQRRWLEHEVDASIRLLDICASTKDLLLSLKEHVQIIQSEKRRKADQAATAKSQSCMRIRKEAKKVISLCNKESTKSSSKSIPPVVCREASEAVNALTEARKIVVSILSSLSVSMSLPKQKFSRWSFVSKAMQKRRVSCGDVSAGAAESIFASLEDVNSDQLETLQQSLGDLESGLECLYKWLIQKRVSLLNLLSF